MRPRKHVAVAKLRRAGAFPGFEHLVHRAGGRRSIAVGDEDLAAEPAQRQAGADARDPASDNEYAQLRSPAWVELRRPR